MMRLSQIQKIKHKYCSDCFKWEENRCVYPRKEEVSVRMKKSGYRWRKKIEVHRPILDSNMLVMSCSGYQSRYLYDLIFIQKKLEGGYWKCLPYLFRCE